ncbi:S26 family signal peptidase [bacterium]|nr:S26 family signal peptidase [bacterium]
MGPKRDKKRTPSFRLGLTLVGILAFLVLGRLFLFDAAIVDGRSMLPGLGSGDVVLIFKAAYGLRNPGGGYFFLWGQPRHRDIVAAVRPDTGSLVIKRVWIEDSGAESGSPRQDSLLFLLGDNKYESVDSRAFGPVPMSNVLGKAFLFPLF